MVFFHPTDSPQDPVVLEVTDTATFLRLFPEASWLSCRGPLSEHATDWLMKEPTLTSMVPEPEQITATSRVPCRMSGISGNE